MYDTYHIYIHSYTTRTTPRTPYEHNGFRRRGTRILRRRALSPLSPTRVITEHKKTTYTVVPLIIPYTRRGPAHTHTHTSILLFFRSLDPCPNIPSRRGRPRTVTIRWSVIRLVRTSRGRRGRGRGREVAGVRFNTTLFGEKSARVVASPSYIIRIIRGVRRPVVAQSFAVAGNRICAPTRSTCLNISGLLKRPYKIYISVDRLFVRPVRYRNEKKRNNNNFVSSRYYVSLPFFVHLTPGQ